MLVSMQADYALRVLVDVAIHQVDGPVITRDIAERQAIPRVFLTKIVAQLAGHSLLRTQRGKGGGVTLAMDPAQINVLSVIETFEGHLQFNQCVADPTYCRRAEGCTIRVLWQDAELHVAQFFRERSLADIVKRVMAAEAASDLLDNRVPALTSMQQLPVR